MYALYKNGKQISKAHKHKECVYVEAFERGVIYTKIGLNNEYTIVFMGNLDEKSA